MVGDLVLYASPLKGPGKKFSYTNRGPYRIVEKKSDQNFVIQNVNDQTRKLVHMERLKEYRKRPAFSLSSQTQFSEGESEGSRRTTCSTRATGRPPVEVLAEHSSDSSSDEETWAMSTMAPVAAFESKRGARPGGARCEARPDGAGSNTRRISARSILEPIRGAGPIGARSEARQEGAGSYTGQSSARNILEARHDRPRSPVRTRSGGAPQAQMSLDDVLKEKRVKASEKRKGGTASQANEIGLNMNPDENESILVNVPDDSSNNDGDDTLTLSSSDYESPDETPSNMADNLMRQLQRALE